MISINGYEVKPTIFPDWTSQVWKLPEDIIEYIKTSHEVEVKWVFESESELFSVMQLGHLITSMISCDIVFSPVKVCLYVPYLPYGRQDKEISNDSTFGQNTFLIIANEFFDVIKTFDAHSTSLLNWEFGINHVINLYPEDAINVAYAESDCDIICFPDKGASERYASLDDDPQVIMGKVRDQSTGEITGLEIVAILDNPGDLNGLKVLIVDDICDGGKTFIEAAKLLYKHGVKEVHLYVSHGIFSKGLDILHEAGIIKVFTKDGLKSEKNYETTV